MSVKALDISRCQSLRLSKAVLMFSSRLFNVCQFFAYISLIKPHYTINLLNHSNSRQIFLHFLPQSLLLALILVYLDRLYRLAILNTKRDQEWDEGKVAAKVSLMGIVLVKRRFTFDADNLHIVHVSNRMCRRKAT